MEVADGSSVVSDKSASLPHLEDNMADLRRRQRLVEEVRVPLQADELLQCAVTIDNLHRLGIEYHFKDEITKLLPLMHASLSHATNNCFFYVSLCFRLLRQHGCYISSNVFNGFKDKDGEFKQELTEDVDGMLALYEASYAELEGEDILEEAREFSSIHLRSLLPAIKHHGLRSRVEFTLDNPFYLSFARSNIKHYLKRETQGAADTYLLHDLAKLDFNIVQSMHHREIKEFLVWWRDLVLQQEHKLARENFLEWFIWSVVVLPDPQHSKFRVELTKVISFIFLIDDIYDIYGTVDELVLFTRAVERWEPDSVEGLPRVMRTGFLALYNTTNSISNMVLKDHGWNPLGILRGTWTAVCRAFLAEKRWITSGNLPKAEEYLRNGVISSGVPMALTHAFVLLGEGRDKESRELLQNPPLISFSAVIFRLWNDVRNVKDDRERGQDGSYVECYMKERGVDSSSLAEAQEHVMEMIEKAWKNLKKASLCSPYSGAFTAASLNIARMAQFVYSYDDEKRPIAVQELLVSLLKESAGREKTCE